MHDCYKGRCKRTLAGEGRNCRTYSPHIEVQLPLTPTRERKMREGFKTQKVADAHN